MKSKAIAAAIETVLMPLLSSILMPLLYSILTFLTPLIHLPC